MPRVFTPNETIVPLLGLDAGLKVKAFLGTSFFVEPSGLLVTAEHVVRDWKGPFGIAVRIADEVKLFKADLKHAAPQRDLAVLNVKDYRPAEMLPLGEDSQFHTNTGLVCLEYSTTIIERGLIDFTPATRMGHIIRRVNLSRYGEAGNKMLELSFPALKGASGAPVVREGHPFDCIGVLIANVNHHLLPAQIVSVLDEKNQILEETQFLLPQGLAVHVNHLVTTLAEATK